MNNFLSWKFPAMGKIMNNFLSWKFPAMGKIMKNFLSWIFPEKTWWLRIQLLAFAGGILLAWIATSHSSSNLDYELILVVLSGSLGGLAFSILQDGKLERPHFDSAGNLIAGTLGDALVGTAGAFILFWLIPAGIGESASSTTSPSIVTLAKGFLGGYGSRILIRKATDRVTQLLLGKMEILATEQDLMALVDRQLGAGLEPGSLETLKTQVVQASSELKAKVFAKTRFARTTNWHDPTTRSIVQRSIPIFEALVQSDPDNATYLGQLGFAYKDAPEPDWAEASKQLNKAILHAPDHPDRSKWHLNLAICRIGQDMYFQQEEPSKEVVQKQIIEDLLRAEQAGLILPKILEEVKDSILYHWISLNRKEIAILPQGDLILRGLPVLVDEPVEMENTKTFNQPEQPEEGFPEQESLFGSETGTPQMGGMQP